MRFLLPASSASRRALIALLPRVSRRLTVAVVAVTVVAALLPAAFIVATGALVGSVPQAVTDGFDSPVGHRLIATLLVVALIYVLQQALVALRSILASALGRRVTAHLQELVMAATLDPPGIGHLEDPAVLDRVSMAQGVGPSSTSGPGGVTPGSAVAGLVDQWGRRIQGLAAMVIVARFRWWLGALLLVGETANLRLYSRAYFGYLEVAISNAQELRRASYFRTLGLEADAAKETRIFGLTGWVRDRFERHWSTAMAQVWARRRKEALVQAVPLLIEPAVAFVAVLALGSATVHGEISLGELVAYVQAVLGAAVFAYLYTEDLQVAYGCGSVPPALELGPHLASHPAVQLRGSAPAGDLPRREIRFEGVRFRYPGRDTDVFTSLDLTIPAGRSLAVVGRNGAGKTTLVKLLARLYDPTGGRITVDGIDLRDLDPSGWQERVAAIFQDFIRYPLSAADNVGFGALRRAGDVEALERAARRAGIADVIERLPSGWDTVLSRQYRGGVDLSGGQWQRVALARALFATDAGAGVLVLDEPTANLDVRAEAELYDRFLELTRGVTTLVISHRFSTVRRADRIVVVENGRVVEEGTHATLVASSGGYAEMFALQAARFATTAGDGGPRE
ncbi:MAG TPA: ABC transporter ATP-binding protein [Acidimicrobiales bacterium]|nr:ABC transporter ATP-binding protein [Acidimicrobiales bacterium]